MRKPILLSALVALFVCPTLASYAGQVDAQSEHGTISESQNGTMRSTESGLTASSTASFSHAPIYVDAPPMAADPVPQVTAAKPIIDNHTVNSQTTNYVWTK